MTLLLSLFNWIYPLTFGALPVFFLPFTQDYYDTTKWTVFIGVILLLLLVQAWSVWRNVPIKLSFGPATIGLGAIAITSIASVLFASPNKVEALLAPFGPITFVALTAASFFAPSYWTPSVSRRFLWSLFGTAAALGLVTIYQFVGVGKLMFPNIPFLLDPLWTPTGSTVATIALLILPVPLFYQGLQEAHKRKRYGLFSLIILMTITVVAGALLVLWQAVPRLSTILLSPREGWSVMLEILKNPRQAIVGVGVENFLTAFTAGRPMRLNLTPLWRARFTTNTNLLFHLTTVYGLLGAASCILFLKNVVARKRHDALLLSLAIGLISLLLVPPSFSLLIVITGLLIVSGTDSGDSGTYTLLVPGKLRFGICALCIAGATGGFYFLGKSYASEIDFARSLVAARGNDGRTTYNTQIRAIQKNPRVSRFHITYSQTNLALAASLSKTIAEQTEATPEGEQKDRQLVSELIQQAISEAKLAINLNPTNILAWEHLARTYQQLIGVVQNTDTWAVATYTQAMRLDPYNPLLALELGGVFVQMKNYTDAITQFSRATNLKPDYANAWYNLANAYELNGDRQQAIKALEETQSLVPPSSSDYTIVTQKLEEVRAGVPKPADASSSASGALTTPAPTPVVVPPLELPN